MIRRTFLAALGAVLAGPKVLLAATQETPRIWLTGPTEPLREIYMSSTQDPDEWVLLCDVWTKGSDGTVHLIRTDLTI